MITYRILTNEDAQSFRGLRLFSLVESPTAFGSYPDEEENLPMEDWEHRAEMTIGAFSDDVKLVGTIRMDIPKKRRLSHVGVLYSFYVLPEFRGQGIGKKLLTEAIATFQKNPEIRKIRLEAIETQKGAIALYTHMGFRHVGNLTKEFLVDGAYYDELIFEYLLA